MSDGAEWLVIQLPLGQALRVSGRRQYADVVAVRVVQFGPRCTVLADDVVL
jgi:hypothetical protein